MNSKHLKNTLKFAFITSIFFSCGKKKTAPVLTLLGDAIVDICLNESFVDPGIQSIDAYDTDISDLIDISSNLDSGTVGSYTITYISTDENDNVSIVERTVNVGICVSSIISSYLVSHDCSVGPVNLISDNQSILEGNTPNEFIINDFSPFINQITGTIEGNLVTIPENTFNANPLPVGPEANVTITGSGTINDTGDEIVINFNYDNDTGFTGPGSCTATYTR